MTGLDPALELLAAFVLGALLAAALVWVLTARRLVAAAERLSAAEERSAAETERRREIEAELDETETALHRLERESAAADERETQLRSLVEQQKSFLAASREELERTFRALAAEALEGSSHQFLKLADQRLNRAQTDAAGELERRKQAIEALLAPLRETLGRLESRTGQIEQARTDAYSRLDEQIKQLAAAAGRLDQKATSLETALTSSSQVRGTWGEIALRNVVEMAGMTEHCDFTVQETIEGGQRPDMVVKLPDGNFIAVDSKAPLTAFMEAAEATDDAARKRALAAHVRDLRGHVRQLASRDYAAAVEGELDLVVLFLPGDPFLAAAVSTEPQLMEEALRARVLIATPTTLLALLRTVAIYFRQRELAENAEAIAATARELYDRAAIFAEHLGGVGKGLTTAVDAYNRAVASFTSRLVPMGRQLEELKTSEGSRRALTAPDPVETPGRQPAGDGDAVGGGSAGVPDAEPTG